MNRTVFWAGASEPARDEMIHRRALGRVALLVALVAFAVGGVAAAEELALSGGSNKYYIALGDSVAAGSEPGLGFRLGGYPNGYPEQLTEYWNSIGEKTKLRNLACPGATTATMISGTEYCDPLGIRSALEMALDEIHAHTNQIKLITITLGANDITNCVFGGNFPACFPDALAGVATNLDTILTAIRAEAGPDVPIVGTNYYDPFVVSWLLGDQQGAIDSYNLIVHPANLVFGAAYAAHDSPVADVETAFASGDFATLVDVPELGGLVPINVANICRWTHTCTEGDFHPNRDGYTVIKDTVLATLP